jgi:hypothetical protein
MKLIVNKQAHSMFMPSRRIDVGHDFFGISNYVLMLYKVYVI